VDVKHVSKAGEAATEGGVGVDVKERADVAVVKSRATSDDGDVAGEVCDMAVDELPAMPGMVTVEARVAKTGMTGRVRYGPGLDVESMTDSPPGDEAPGAVRGDVAGDGPVANLGMSTAWALEAEKTLNVQRSCVFRCVPPKEMVVGHAVVQEAMAG
jgi:hypothetical protein